MSRLGGTGGKRSLIISSKVTEKFNLLASINSDNELETKISAGIKNIIN